MYNIRLSYHLKSNRPWLWPYRVTQGQIWCHWTPHIWFPINGYSNIWPNSVYLRDITLCNLSDIDFDLSRSLKGKCDCVIGLPIHNFLLMVNSNIVPNQTPLRDIRLQNVSDLDFDLSRSLKVKCDSAIGLPLHGFLLTFNINIGPNSALLRDISLRNLGDL